MSISESVNVNVYIVHCRFVAESELENKPEGTFLLRDSAQPDYIFSVSFRRYARTLHARIEVNTGLGVDARARLFSFDASDPQRFAAPTVPALLAHYKESANCMFFEPLLTVPLHRREAFTLSDLTRAVIATRVTEYDLIAALLFPRASRSF